MAAPGTVLNKLVYGMIALLTLVAAIGANGRVPFRTLSPLFIFAIFSYGYLLSYCFNSDRDLANQLFLSVGILLIVYYIDWYQLDFERQIKVAAIFLCLFSIATLVLLLSTQGTALGRVLLGAVTEFSQGGLGRRSFSESTLLAFRVGTAPFLFLPYCLFLASFLQSRRARDLFASILIALVILLTTSRGLLLACALMTCWLITARIRPALRVIVFLALAIVGLILVESLASETRVFSANDSGNLIKLGHISSYLYQLTPAKALFGQGLASLYFSEGYQAVVSQTEITPMDMARFFGVPLMLILFFVLFFPTSDTKSYGGENLTRVLIFSLYVGISLTNPVLFNSFGLLFVVWYWSNVLSIQRGAQKFSASRE